MDANGRSALARGPLDTHEFGTLAVTRVEDGIALVTLDRPDRLNALSVETFDDLNDFAVLAGRDPALRAIVLTGAGRAFCAGGDYETVADLGAIGVAETYARLTRGAAAVAAVHNIPVPVIAAVNGAASGGGLALALTADLRLAAPEAVFVAPFLKLGISACDVGVSWLLPRIVGMGRASEMMFTGRRVDAAEAERIGLVSRVVPAGELLDAALAHARQIVSYSPLAVALTKEGLRLGVDAPSLEAAMALENRQQALTLQADELGRLSALRQARVAPREP
jgi:enoyl-CoA hydratase